MAFGDRYKIFLIIPKKNLLRFVNSESVRNFANNKQWENDKVKTKQYTEKQEQLARFAKAMGHPARIAILSFLAKQDSCYFGDIHEELPIAKATVSQHLKELKDAGLIQGEIEAPKVRYCINRENWEFARLLFVEFLNDCTCTGTSCCG